MIHLNAILFNTQKRGWDKSPSLSIIFGLSSKTQWLSGLYYTDFISFTALLNCAEVGRRNRILTNYRFLSHSLFYCHFSQKRDICSGINNPEHLNDLSRSLQNNQSWH